MNKKIISLNQKRKNPRHGQERSMKLVKEYIYDHVYVDSIGREHKVPIEHNYTTITVWCDNCKEWIEGKGENKGVRCPACKKPW